MGQQAGNFQDKRSFMSAIDLTPTPGAPLGFPFEENAVRHRLGLTKDEMRSLREKRLVEGPDFERYKKRVWLSQDAATRLLALADVKLEKTRVRTTADDVGPEKTAAARKNAPPPEPASPAEETVALKVVNCTLANKHMLTACPVAEDHERPRTLLRVRVRSAANFRRGMELPARQVTAYAGMTDLYDLARPTPRKKGQW
jgi:hypothetical protein